MLGSPGEEWAGPLLRGPNKVNGAAKEGHVFGSPAQKKKILQNALTAIIMRPESTESAQTLWGGGTAKASKRIAAKEERIHPFGLPHPHKVGRREGIPKRGLASLGRV